MIRNNHDLARIGGGVVAFFSKIPRKITAQVFWFKQNLKNFVI